MKRESSKSPEINFGIASYEDLFSDFDSRNFTNRALSVDFLEEAERASRDKKEGGVVLELFLPKEKRNPKEEAIIKNRLKKHFSKHNEIMKKEKSKILKNGILFILFGLAFMFLGAYIIFSYSEKPTLWIEFLIVILEPGGWFLFWEGLDLVIFTANENKKRFNFYKKMSTCKIKFKDKIIKK